jgi:hypothetical protein
MPVQFICPNCRRTLSVTRRKVGHEVTCPKCAAAITVPDNQPALAGAVNLSAARSGLDQVDMGDFVDFDDLSDLMVDKPRLRHVRIPKVIPTEAPAESGRVLVSRTSIYLQSALLVLVAAVAFGLGYWWGGVDAQRGSQSAPSAQE